MSQQYVSVQWNHKKRFYDMTLWLGIALFVASYMALSLVSFVGIDALSPMILLMRAFATCAFLMLTIILCIGPLCRLDSRFLPLLYNRRHFGVSMFIVALVHGILAIIWYHGFGVVNPIESLFSVQHEINNFSDIPFQPIGAIALIILFVMAATSHDFWNANLGPKLWKSLHMSVYLAYGLVIFHLSAGALQESDTGIHPLFVILSVVLVCGLHLVSGFRETSRDARGLTGSEWVDVGQWQDIENNHGMVVCLDSGERVAVFRYDEIRIAAVGNACKHQLGPLGEGRVIDGCITCPWHGFQYRPEDGRSPAPYNEMIPTYRVRLEADRILLHPTPLPDGTAREVAIVGSSS